MNMLVEVALDVAACALVVCCVVALFLGGAYLRRLVWDRMTRTLAPARPTLGLLLREAAAFAHVVWWSIARRADDDTDGAADVVVLVHGMSADGSCMQGWARALAPLGVAVVAPSHGLWLAPLEVHAGRLAAYVSRLLSSSTTSGRRPRLHFVGHSMGGIVVRAMLHEHPALAAATVSVTTVATPHAGSAGGRRIPWSRIARLTTGSTLFASLPPLLRLVPHAQRTTIGAVDDAIVYPLSTTHEPDDDDAARHDLAGLGHATLLVDDGVGALVADVTRRALGG
jgi:pimeloyl-ACP methyl ester carboxylesterase